MIKWTMKVGSSIPVKGDVLLTDPCYYLDESNDKNPQLGEHFWQKLVDEMYKEGGDNGEGPYILTLADDKTGKSVDILIVGTAYGDGGYHVTGNAKIIGDEVGVDAGLICAANVSELNAMGIKFDDVKSGLGQIVKGAEGTATADADNGSIMGSNWALLTDDQPYEEDEFPEDEEFDESDED